MLDHEKSEDPHFQTLYQMHKKNRSILIVLVATIVLIIVGNFAIGMFFKDYLFNLRDSQKRQQEESKITNQFLLSTIDWSSYRTKVVLFMRDEIIQEWKRTGIRIDMDEAYKIAECIIKQSECFPNVDPFIVLAMQNVESTFRRGLVSPMGAIGLNQIMPSTGRLLCGSLGLSYSDSILYDVRVSTYLAVKLIDVLYSQYHNWDQVLADYNGGPYQAYYFKKDRSKLATETCGYVPTVSAKHKEYTEKFKTYRVDQKLLVEEKGDSVTNKKTK